MEHENDGDTDYNWCDQYIKELVRGREDLKKRGQVETIQTTIFF